MVIGDSYNDIVPGKQLGMTTVMAGWGQSGEKNIADFFFDSPSAMLGNLPKVLMNAEQLQQILNR